MTQQARPRMHRTIAGAFFLLPLLSLLLWAAPARAQLLVTLQLKRATYMLHEPVIATVIITNNTGREVMLDDTEEAGQWFSFQITNAENKVIPPRNLKYELEPLPIAAGATVKRTVNLSQLYALDDYGLFKVRASVLFPPLGKFFSSKYHPLEITEGKVIWKETVGVPEDANAYRTFELLTMEHDKGKALYVRIQGQDDGSTYGCYELGPQVAEFMPQTMFDRANHLWILQLASPKTYFLTRIGTDGKFEGQSTYVTPKSIPHLRKLADGTMQIVGAFRQDRVAQEQHEAEAPKLSDRPAGLPGVQK